MRHHLVLPIRHKRIDVLEETSLVTPFLRRVIHVAIPHQHGSFPNPIPAPNSQVQTIQLPTPTPNSSQNTKKETNLLQTKINRIPRVPLQIIHNCPRQTTHYIDTLTERYEDPLHVIAVVGAAEGVVENICFERLEGFVGLGEAEFCYRYWGVVRISVLVLREENGFFCGFWNDLEWIRGLDVNRMGGLGSMKGKDFGEHTSTTRFPRILHIMQESRHPIRSFM
jgi:hypothetical protein